MLLKSSLYYFQNLFTESIRSSLTYLAINVIKLVNDNEVRLCKMYE